MSAIEYLIFRIMWLFRKLPFNLLSVGSSKAIFADYFKDFDKISAVKRIFGEKTTEILNQLTVEFSLIGGYMYVDPGDGHLVISKKYLRNGNKIDIYLDLIHELCHVKQYIDGKELFDPRYAYVERPTEIEAYYCCVQEAKRIGLNEERICHYLKTEWISDIDLKRLAKTLKISCA